MIIKCQSKPQYAALYQTGGEVSKEKPRVTSFLLEGLELEVVLGRRGGGQDEEND